MTTELSVMIDGVKYIAFEPLIPGGMDIQHLKEKVQRNEGILQGVVQVVKSFWGNTVIVRVLIPEYNAVAFANE